MDDKPKEMYPEAEGKLVQSPADVADEGGATDHGIGLKLFDVLIEHKVAVLVNEPQKVNG